MEIFIFYLFWINWTFSLKNKKKSEGLRPGSKTQTNIFFKDCLKVLLEKNNKEKVKNFRTKKCDVMCSYRLGIW